MVAVRAWVQQTPTKTSLFSSPMWNAYLTRFWRRSPLSCNRAPGGVERRDPMNLTRGDWDGGGLDPHGDWPEQG